MKSLLDSQQLRVFATVARTQNMGLAAKELGLTPSAVSHCLKALETDLGCLLFERTSRRVALTDQGTQLLAEAEQILEHMTHARVRVRAWNAWGTGSLKIGAEASASQYILPAVLREFHESFPAYDLALRPCSSRQCGAALVEGSLDLALAVEPEPLPRVHFLPIGEDDLIFCTHPLHPWAARRLVSREDLAQRKLIIPDRTSPTHALIQAYFREESLQIESWLEVADDRTILEMVRHDLGIGLLPRWLARDDLAAGRITGFPVGRKRIKRRWGVLHARSRPFNPAEDLFVNLAKTVFESVVNARIDL